MTKRVMVGAVPIGGGAPVSIQSMTNTDMADVAATVNQILGLEAAGCEIVRASVYDEACAKAIGEIKRQIHIPLVADIHFDYRLAIAAVENGADKLRFNPGNIGGEAKVRELTAAAKEHGVPIRIGVNAGSLEKDLLRRYGGPTPEAMVESALNHTAILERENFEEIIISLKASNVRDTVSANRLIRTRCSYPLHIGITEAGAGESAVVKSACGLGALLMDGIGDTIRVSITGDPVQEVEAAKLILKSMGLRKKGLEVISCPTCGRTCIDLLAAVQKVERELHVEEGYLKVAVMGCVVNGPGEAREADIGVAFGKSGCAMFKNGAQYRTVPMETAVDELIQDAKELLKER